MPHPTNNDIIRRAHRLLGTLTGGASPAGSQASDSMERLQSVLLEQPGLILRARWCEHAVDDDYTAKEGQRLTVSAGDVTLPMEVTPLDGCTRPPLDFARVQIIGDADNAGLWVFVATLGEWRQVDGLEIGEEFPFGLEDVDGIAAQLAVAMQDEYGENYTAGPRTVARAAASLAAFRARFMRAAPTDWTRPRDYDVPACPADYI